LNSPEEAHAKFEALFTKAYQAKHPEADSSFAVGYAQGIIDLLKTKCEMVTHAANPVQEREIYNNCAQFLEKVIKHFEAGLSVDEINEVQNYYSAPFKEILAHQKQMKVVLITTEPKELES
jgi:hypothetical protein